MPTVSVGSLHQIKTALSGPTVGGWSILGFEMTVGVLVIGFTPQAAFATVLPLKGGMGVDQTPKCKPVLIITSMAQSS